MFAFENVPVSFRVPCLGVAALLLTSGCAQRIAPAAGGVYRVVWTAGLAAGNAQLVGVTSPPLRIGAGEVRVRTDSQRAVENRPAFPEFLARLSATPQAGQIELITRTTVLEAIRNRKGKLKIHKRFIGALLPVRTGEKLGVSGPGDPVAVDVVLERAP